jgi:hypothetical protein
MKLSIALPAELTMPIDTGHQPAGRLRDLIEATAGRDVAKDADTLIGDVMAEIEAAAFLAGWRAATAVGKRRAETTRCSRGGRAAVPPRAGASRWPVGGWSVGRWSTCSRPTGSTGR